MMKSLDRLLTPARRRYPWFIGAAMWLGWLVSLLAGGGRTDLAGHLIGTDFVAFYTAGKILLMGRSAELYSLELAHQIQQPLYGGASLNFNPYLNPPFYALLCAPFALLPHTLSAVLWMSTQLACLWFSLKLLGLEKPRKTFGLVLTWLPGFSAISFGQNAFLTLLLFSLAYALSDSSLRRRGRNFWMGLSLSLLLYKPQLLFGVGVFLLLEAFTQWQKKEPGWSRGLLGLAVGSAAIIGLNIILLPEASLAYVHYASKVAANLMNVPGFPMWNAHATQSFWLGLFPGQIRLSQALYLGCALAGLGLFLRFWHRLRAAPGAEAELRFAAGVCLSVWLTPYLMVYDWVLLVIPAVLLWRARPASQPAWRVLFAILWVTLLLSSVLTFAQLQLWGRAIQISVPVLALALYLATRELMSFRGPSREIPSA